MERRNLFADLGLGIDATGEEVQRAFRKLAMELHPDRNPGEPHAAHERMVVVNKAYEALSIDEVRAYHRNALQLEALRRQMAELDALERQVERNGLGWTLSAQGWMPEGGKA